MTQHHTDLILRPITGPDELDLFNSLPYTLNDEVAGDLTAGRRRPGWLWLALRGDEVTARAGWWSRPGGSHPLIMDIFDGSPEDAAALFRAAREALFLDGTPPKYVRFVPVDWREHDDSRRIVEDRMAVLRDAGARLLVERLRLEWPASAVVPVPSGRLTFRPPRGADELIGLMTRVLDGTLDAYSLADLATMTPAEAAREHYREEIGELGGDHGWWLVGELPGGAPAGFVVPAHNGYHHTIAYLAVVPEHRGHGYSGDLLAAGTAVLARQGAPRIRAATDVGNTPMAAAFARAGYAVTERRIDMTWS